MDVDARIQLFDLKTKYQFQTTPGIDQYNTPLYSIQTEPGAQTIASFPVYQGFSQASNANGIPIPFYTERYSFENLWPNYVQSLPQAGVGDGTTGPYTLTLPFFPAVPGHVDISGIIATGSTADPICGTDLNLNVPTTSVYSAVYFMASDSNGKNVVVADSGQFLSGNTSGDLYGLLMQPGSAPLGNAALANGGALATPYSTTQNTINYNTGVATNVYFPTAIPDGNSIQAQCYFYEQGIPRAVLFYNNCLTLRPPPSTQTLIQLDAYLTPAAFLNTANTLSFGYMTEYLARGAARKILSDTGDIEQFQFYEPLFKEQEIQVWKRSQRQFTATRTNTIFSRAQGLGNYNNVGQG